MATTKRTYGRQAQARARAAGDAPPRRSRDFPVDKGTNYLIRGIPPALKTQLDTRLKAADRSLRWVVLTLLHKYAKGDITL